MAKDLFAEMLWRELRRRQGNGLVPLRKDWVAVTEERLRAALECIEKKTWTEIFKKEKPYSGGNNKKGY